MKTTYTPHPIDTSDVVLSDDLLSLTELLAKNTHDNWAIKRIQEGYKYGINRDDSIKETPCLVPYEQLPESEKEYDRKSAMEALKLIIKLNYKIEKNI